MNDTFSSILKYVIIFWVLVTGLAIVLGPRIGTFFVNSDSINTLSNADPKNAITVLYEIATFKVTEQVPLFVTLILDTMSILTVIAVIMAITDR